MLSNNVPLHNIAATTVAAPIVRIPIGFSFSYGNAPLFTVVDRDIEIYAKNLYLFFGPNGCGKSTFLNILSGLQRPTSGAIYWGSQDDSSSLAISSSNYKSYRSPLLIARWEKGVRRTFQFPIVPTRSTAFDFIHAGIRIPSQETFLSWLLPHSNVGFGNNDKQRILDLIKTIDAFKALEIIGNLSYGHKRLLVTLQALAANPTLLLFDEPFANLNLNLSNQLGNIIYQKIQNESCAAIVVEHLPEAIIDYVDAILTIQNRQLVMKSLSKKLSEKRAEIQSISREVMQESGKRYDL